MESVLVSSNWKAGYPGAAAGFLAMQGVVNPPANPALDDQKTALEVDLRARYGDWDRPRLSALAALGAYRDYYKQFKKTYHVQLQLESILFKGKSIPNVAALVEAMFMAELKNMLLTAGHDLDKLHGRVSLDVSDGSQRYILINGQEQSLKPGDMYISDQAGVLSSIIYGPDQRTCILGGTQRVLFTVYAPPGIAAEAVVQHLGDIETYVRLVAPQAQTEFKEVYQA